MKIRVLGSAAGGGFPQWNCNCRNCTGVRKGTVRARIRTQSSIAVCGADCAAWALVNASPDILVQLKANPVLQPARAARDTAIAAVVLVDGQIDHTTGLLMLRESTRPLSVWCTDAAYADLTRGNPILNVLAHTRRRCFILLLRAMRYRILRLTGSLTSFSARVLRLPGGTVAKLLGDPAGCAVYSDFYTYAMQQGLAPKALMIGQSRGGLMCAELGGGESPKGERHRRNLPGLRRGELAGAE